MNLLICKTYDPHALRGTEMNRSATRLRVHRFGARYRNRLTASRGLSLLEVMLALAILGLALAAIGELMRIGSRNAEAARDMSTAQILCETKMAEVVTGMLPSTPTSNAPIQDVGSGNDWLYAVETQPAEQEGLLAVRVTVQQNPEYVSRPVSFSLVRWMIDPTYQPTTTTTETTSSSTSTTSS